MLIFWIHIIFLITTRAGLHALMLNNSSVLAPALPLKAYSALIGQFRRTSSR